MNRNALDKLPSRRCQFLNCIKTAKSGGFCISHGGGKECSVEGCRTSVVSRGYCVAHGGGKRCQSQGCTKSAQTGGFCWIHGGGKTCHHPHCTKRAQSGGACIAHGGGKRCRTEGCTKVVQYDGRCVSHGGYRTCSIEDCSLKAFPNGLCARHGGQSDCRLKTCSRKALRGGLCRIHRDQLNSIPNPSRVSSTPNVIISQSPSMEVQQQDLMNAIQHSPPQRSTSRGFDHPTTISEIHNNYTTTTILPQLQLRDIKSDPSISRQRQQLYIFQDGLPHPIWHPTISKVQYETTTTIRCCFYPNCMRFAKVNNRCLQHQI